MSEPIERVYYEVIDGNEDTIARIIKIKEAEIAGYTDREMECVFLTFGQARDALINILEEDIQKSRNFIQTLKSCATLEEFKNKGY